jgi:uncharacterized membrane protein
MRRSGFLGILLLGLVALVAGLVGYQIGLTSNAVASGATVVVTGGFPGFGLLFFLFFLGFLFFAFAGRRRGAWGPGHGYGPWAGRMGPGGPGGPGGSPDRTDPGYQWIAQVHQALHEDGTVPERPTDAAAAG